MIEALQDEQCIESITHSGSCCEGARRPFNARREPLKVVVPQESYDTITAIAEGTDSPIQERGQDYGPPEVNLACIAKMWQAYLDNREPGRPLDIHDVCYMNSLQKLSRLARTPRHKDSLRDLSRGYLEIAEQA